ncbi:hypothetical protein [Acinetobacter sp. YH16042]|uniref:hypothetical protein n=1 Tax=Acinetobacter sp. YH16042 TaxID=2601186 RepID=UPI0015D40C69|nr:hypothetical protein [Acinetobacter sp. YH16042]
MKKLKILSFIFFATFLTACQQPNDEVAAAESQNADLTTEQATQQFEQSDAQISQYLDVLDAQSTSIKEKPKSYVMTTLMNIKLTTCLPCSNSQPKTILKIKC